MDKAARRVYRQKQRARRIAAGTCCNGCPIIPLKGRYCADCRAKRKAWNQTPRGKLAQYRSMLRWLERKVAEYETLVLKD
jgi:hypothetical protein